MYTNTPHRSGSLGHICKYQLLDFLYWNQFSAFSLEGFEYWFRVCVFLYRYVVNQDWLQILPRMSYHGCIKMNGPYPEIMNISSLAKLFFKTFISLKHLSDYRTVGLSDRRTIGLSDCRAIIFLWTCVRVPTHGVCCDKISACRFLVLKSISRFFIGRFWVLISCLKLAITHTSFLHR
jgi:hypothetical protein